MRGLTAVEVAVLLSVIAVLVVVVGVVLRPTIIGRRDGTECMNNVRNLVDLLEAGAHASNAYPEHGGVNLILWLVTKGEIEGEDSLSTLFCPVDSKQSLAKAGGPKAYAGRDLRAPGCAVQLRSAKPVVLVCDDSEDHHDGEGFVVGLTGGSVKYRHKVEDWNLDPGTRVEVGPNSVVPELRCLRTD